MGVIFKKFVYKICLFVYKICSGEALDKIDSLYNSRLCTHQRVILSQSFSALFSGVGVGAVQMCLCL